MQGIQIKKRQGAYWEISIIPVGHHTPGLDQRLDQSITNYTFLANLKIIRSLKVSLQT